MIVRGYVLRPKSPHNLGTSWAILHSPDGRGHRSSTPGLALVCGVGCAHIGRRGSVVCRCAASASVQELTNCAARAVLAVRSTAKMRRLALGALLLLTAVTALLTVLAASAAPRRYEPTWTSLAQNYRVPDWFRDAKFGIYGHWGVYSVPAYAVRPAGRACEAAGGDCSAACPRNTTPDCGPCQGSGRCTCPQGIYSSTAFYPHYMYVEGSPVQQHHVKTYGADFGYKDFIPNFTAPLFNPTAWAKLYRRAGAQYAGPVSEHCDGFAMWNTSFSEYNAAQMGPMRDIVSEVAAEVRLQGLRTVATFHHHWLWGWYRTSVFGAGVSYNRSGLDVGDPQYQLTSMGHGGLYGERTCCADSGCQEVSSSNSSCGNCTVAPCSSQLFMNYTMAKAAEVVRMVQPDLVYFDGLLRRRIDSDFLTSFLSYYYNAAENWTSTTESEQTPVVSTYKGDDFEKGAGVMDIERGGDPCTGGRGKLATCISPVPWQTDDSIDPYEWGWSQHAVLKNSTEIIHELVDIVSKNGNLLLNVPPRADGSFDPRVIEILHEVGDWLALNGQAIYASRPFLVCCEGGVAVVEDDDEEEEYHDDNDVVLASARGSGRSPIYTSTDEYRFTQAKAQAGTNCSAIFIVAFGWTQDERLVRSLNTSVALPGAITNVSIIGADEVKVTWSRGPTGLALDLPKQMPSQLTHHAWSIRVHLDGATSKEIDLYTAGMRNRIVGGVATRQEWYSKHELDTTVEANKVV
jgi:alpha-L-fucosidase